MSIDYSDMAFPKPGKKKKLKNHNNSILKTERGTCYLCARLNNDYRNQYTEEHHVLFGSGMREKSEEEGLKVNLCLKHHREGPEAVHNNQAIRIELCRIAQEEYEKTHTHSEWMGTFKKNYLEEEDAES